jgi:hypothetical protein
MTTKLTKELVNKRNYRLCSSRLIHQEFQMPKFNLGYMCLTDWEHEFPHVCSGTLIYPTVEALKSSRGCTDECGIVEVAMTGTVIQQAQDLTEEEAR